MTLPRANMKICGLSTSDSVAAAVAGGASHIGFIFFEKSPRNVSPEQAAELVSEKANAQSVAVTVDAEDTRLEEINRVMNPDMLQLHGSESADRVNELKARYGKPIIKALAIRNADDLAKVEAYDGVADLFLLDAKPPVGSDLPGGNGVSFDWSLVASLKTDTPILLSGGIDLSNVDEAMSYVADQANSLIGLDLSSGVEASPGVKDNAKIKAFLTKTTA